MHPYLFYLNYANTTFFRRESNITTVFYIKLELSIRLDITFYHIATITL